MALRWASAGGVYSSSSVTGPSGPYPPFPLLPRSQSAAACWNSPADSRIPVHPFAPPPPSPLTLPPLSPRQPFNVFSPPPPPPPPPLQHTSQACSRPSSAAGKRRSRHRCRPSTSSISSNGYGGHTNYTLAVAGTHGGDGSHNKDDDEDGEDTIRMAATPAKRPRVNFDTFEPSRRFMAEPLFQDTASVVSTNNDPGYNHLGQASFPPPGRGQQDRDIVGLDGAWAERPRGEVEWNFDWDRERHSGWARDDSAWGRVPRQSGLSSLTTAVTASSLNLMTTTTARLSIADHVPPSRVNTLGSAAGDVSLGGGDGGVSLNGNGGGANGGGLFNNPPPPHMERTASGFSILSDTMATTPNYDLEDEYDTTLVSDAQAAKLCRWYADSFDLENPDSQHERILRGLIETHCEAHEIDRPAIDSVLSAANELFFGGCLAGRVKWDWSDRTSAQYMDHIIGTTVVRRAPDGYETLIVLSKPIIRDSGYSRRLAISTFLHELIHCFLFIKCGFKARLGGGHTPAFREIANLIDDWAGPGKLHLRHMRADLSRFEEPLRVSGGGGGSSGSPPPSVVSLLSEPFPPLHFAPPRLHHQRSTSASTNPSLPALGSRLSRRRGGSGIASSAGSSIMTTSASSSQSSISSAASFCHGPDEQHSLFDTIRRSSTQQQQQQQQQHAHTAIGMTGRLVVYPETSHYHPSRYGPPPRIGELDQDGWWYGGVQDQWDECACEWR